MDQTQVAGTVESKASFTFSGTATKLLALGQIVVLLGFINAGYTFGDGLLGKHDWLMRVILLIQAIVQFLMVPVLFIAFGRAKYMTRA